VRWTCSGEASGRRSFARMWPRVRRGHAQPLIQLTCKTAHVPKSAQHTHTHMRRERETHAHIAMLQPLRLYHSRCLLDGSHD
jgi:hypothetical protein